jgi:hypothetical protein
MEILRLSSPRLHHAKEELISEGFVSYKRPYWEVKNIPQRREHGKDDKARYLRDVLNLSFLTDPRPDRNNEFSIP